MKKKKFTKHHPEFWIKQGFTEEESIIKSKDYSIWFKENSIRPHSIKYWMKLGFSEDEAIIKKEAYKSTRPKRFNRYSIEDQMLKFNLSEAEAVERVKVIKESLFNNYSVEQQMKKYNLSENEAIEKIEKIKKSNDYWIGKTEEEISNIKGKIKNTVKYKFSQMSDFDFDSMSYHNKEFWMKKGFTEEDSIKKAYETSQKNRDKFQIIKNENPDFMKDKTSVYLNYWINKGFSEDEAMIKLKERQATFSLEKCIKKHGDEIGRKKFDDRQKKWHMNYTKSSYSRVSQELFISILTYLSEEDKLLVRFATIKYGVIMNDNRNYEMCVRTKENNFFPDFVLRNKIIEFDGVYYHRNTPENKQRELIRDNKLKAMGYQIIHIREDEYKKDKKTIVQKCINFLTK